MNASVGRNMVQRGSQNLLVLELERKLGSLIGNLSKFIVERSYTEITRNGHEELDLENARSMCSSIIDEANILLGPKKAKELNMEFERIIEGYFKEGMEND
jgi:hypothetical protein